jgi:hypothetical protein
MSFDWVTWSDPVAVWWLFLIAVSATNIVLWFKLRALLAASKRAGGGGAFTLEPLPF